MFKKMLKSLIVFLIIILFFNQETVSAFFDKNLNLGSRGSAVLELQKILNSNSDTRVSEFGAGSLGQETDYFGPLTREAVIKFQNKYKQEILTPVGLNFGTGFVGESTRKKLNQIITGLNSGQSQNNQADNDLNSDLNKNFSYQNYPILPNEDFYLLFINPSFSESGKKVRINGSNLEKTKKIIVGTQEITNFNFEPNFFLSFDLPQLNEGQFEVFAVGENFKSNSLKITIVENERNQPEISNFPNLISFNQEFSISGRNFTEDLEINTPFGSFKAVNISGNNANFRVTLPSQMLNSQNFEYAGFIQVKNKFGQSDFYLVNYKYEK